jgi:hypothetical protein
MLEPIVPTQASGSQPAPNAIEVSAWKNGKFDGHKPISLGIRVGVVNVKKFFNKKWGVFLVEFDETTVPVKPPMGFWADCPELRHPAIGNWMRRKGLVPWSKGIPPRMLLSPQGENRFRLSI